MSVKDFYCIQQRRDDFIAMRRDFIYIQSYHGSEYRSAAKVAES